MEEKRFSVTRRRPRRREAEAGWEPLEFEPMEPEAPEARTLPGTGDRWVVGSLSALEAFGLAVAALAAIAIVFNFVLPWSVFTYDPSANVSGVDGVREVWDREDYRQEGTSYTKRLQDWPIVAYSAAVVAGIGLLGTRDRRLSSTQRHGVSVALLAVIALGGFILILAGTRHLGIQNANLIRNLLAEEVWTTYRLHVVPYLTLVSGLLFLFGGLFFGRLVPPNPLRPLSSTGASGYVVAAVALGLLLMPLLPFAFFELQGPLGEERFYIHERNMANLEENDFWEEEVTEPLGQTRSMLWVVFGFSLASMVPALFPNLSWGRSVVLRYIPYLLQLAAGIPLAAAFYFLVVHYERFNPSHDLSFFFNPFLPFAVLATLGAYVHYLVRVPFPFQQRRGPQETHA